MNLLLSYFQACVPVGSFRVFWRKQRKMFGGWGGTGEETALHVVLFRHSYHNWTGLGIRGTLELHIRFVMCLFWKEMEEFPQVESQAGKSD